MRNSKILARLRAGQPARLAMMGYFLPPFIAYAAHHGFDGIWLDLEHRAFEAREVQALLGFFHRYDIDCMLRPATQDKTQLYRYLEDGATGLVVPHVTTPDDARRLVQAVKFPPVGDRGTNPTSLDVDYGISGTREQIVEHAQRETFLLVQVESPAAVRNADALAAVNGVDGLFIGPADLGVRMRLEPEDKQIPYSETLDRVAAACQKAGNYWGTTSVTKEELHELKRRNANFLMWGVDHTILRDGLATAEKDLNEVLGTRD